MASGMWYAALDLANAPFSITIKKDYQKYNDIHVWSCSRAVLNLLPVVIIESKKT